MTQPNYHLMKVKAKIHSKYYSVPIVAVSRKTEDGGKEGKNKKQKTKTNKIKGSNKEKEKGGNQDGPCRRHKNKLLQAGK